MAEPAAPRTEVLYFDHNGHPLDSAEGAEQAVIIEYDKDGRVVNTTYGGPGAAADE